MLVISYSYLLNNYIQHSLDWQDTEKLATKLIGDYFLINNIIKQYFGFSNFRPDQVPVVQSMIDGNDTYAVLTTGGGKSLCFQSVALLNYMKNNSSTIVISPLVSLMNDQVESLTRRGIKSGQINHSVSPEERSRTLGLFSENKIPILYLSPEQISHEDVMSSLCSTKIASVVYDEAHAVSLWGVSFRPSYLNVDSYIQEIERNQKQRIQRCGFTATSRSDVTDEVISIINMTKPVKIIGSVDRPNIAFHVVKTNDKNSSLLEIINENSHQPTIVYCSTVKNVKSLKQRLIEEGIKSEAYYGAMKSSKKREVQSNFLNNSVDVLIATNAFGMGVDKPDVRLVIHYDMPNHLENYYQEAGRAGRDGQSSKAYLLYTPSSRKIHDYFLHYQFPDQETIDDIRSTITALTSDGPISLTEQLIASACHTSVDSRFVSSAIRILVENGCISASRDGAEHSFLIDVIDPHRAVDYEAIERSKSVLTEKLATMKRFSISTRCLRSFLIEYLSGEKAKDFCGSCSNCLDKISANKRISETDIAPSKEAILSAIKASEGRIETTISILMGVNSSRMKRKGYDKLPAFGSLKQYNAKKIRDMTLELTKSGLIYEENGSYHISENQCVNDNIIKPAIAELRKKISCQSKLPEFLVLSDKQCLMLSSVVNGEDILSKIESMTIHPKALIAARNILK